MYTYLTTERALLFYSKYHECNLPRSVEIYQTTIRGGSTQAEAAPTE